MEQLKIRNTITNRNDGLNIYLNQVSRCHMITPEEEVELAEKIQMGDTQALEKMVSANLRFVISVAKQYQYTGASLGDMIQDGNMGLIIAAKNFDPTKGFKFISYAVWWIRQSILEGVAKNRNAIRLPMNQIAQINKIIKVIVQFEQVHYRVPSDVELSEIVEIPLENLRKVMATYAKVESLDAPLDNEAGVERSLTAILPAEIPATDSSFDIPELHAELKRVMMILSPRERCVITYSYGLDGKPERSLQEIAQELNLTRERVRQIKESSIRKLRKSNGLGIIKKFL